MGLPPLAIRRSLLASTRYSPFAIQTAEQDDSLETARVQQDVLASREGGPSKASCLPSSKTQAARWAAMLPDRHPQSRRGPRALRPEGRHLPSPFGLRRMSASQPSEASYGDTAFNSRRLQEANWTSALSP